MKLVITPLYEASRKSIVEKYPALQKSFNDLEEAISNDPFASAEELIIYGNKTVHARKRYVKTNFFSGMLPETYLYLTLTYALLQDGRALLMLAKLRDFID